MKKKNKTKKQINKKYKNYYSRYLLRNNKIFKTTY